MNWFEFILAFLAMVIIGMWGLMIICGRYGLLDTDKTKKNKVEKAIKDNKKED